MTTHLQLILKVWPGEGSGTNPGCFSFCLFSLSS